MPFLPLYIAELGVRDVGQIALWTGLTLGATPAVTAVSAPLWGRVGDRFGSKVLVVRSLAAFVLTKGAMAFVTAPWQLFALRALLGIFAGYGALTLSMAAESVPRARMTAAIGTVQIAQRLGPAVGPIIGGLLAPLVGLRRSFLLAAALYLLALVLVAVVYREPRSARARQTPRPLVEVLGELIRTPGFGLLLAVVFGMQLVDRSFGPILPLYIADLGVSGGRLVIVSGALFSLLALVAAVGHWTAPLLLRRFPPSYLIGVSAIVTAVAVAAAGLTPSLAVITAVLVTSGAAIGIAMTAAYASAGALLPHDAQVTGFSVMTTASLLGLAVSPVLAGIIGSSGIYIVFALDAVVLTLLALAVWQQRRTASAGPAGHWAPKQ